MNDGSDARHTDTPAPASSRSGPPRLSRLFGRLPIGERRALVIADPDLSGAAFSGTDCTDGMLELADALVENAVGLFPVPLGIARRFLIDGVRYEVPMATEEPSVVAAASFAARLVASGGGFRTRSTEPVMTAQIFLERTAEGCEDAIIRRRHEIEDALTDVFGSLRRRGGGLREIRAVRLPETGLVKVEIDADVRDAMGANVLNTAAEAAAPLLEALTGGRALMRILTNEAVRRRAQARFSLPVRFLQASGMEGAEVARRIVLAAEAAREDRGRAVTHNKGIMNGITALALATGNDTRAVEAAAHAWAARDGLYRGLSSFSLDGDSLVGELELPLPLAVVGGTVGFHPAAGFSLRLLGNPDAPGLARIAAAVGLAQNLAALRALVTDGIQRGHMLLHARRLAFRAGARGRDIDRAADRIASAGVFSEAAAAEAIRSLREEDQS